MIGLAVALTIGLAWYAVAGALVSLLWRLNKAKLDALAVRQLSGLALTAAILPLDSTFAVTCGIVLPSFFLNEPEQSGEDLSWKLIIFGGGAFVGANFGAAHPRFFDCGKNRHNG